MNVYDRILQTRPNSFVTFTDAGPRENGESPMSHSATGLSYGFGHFLPGGPSWYATGSGSLTFNGKFCSSPRDGGSGSVELIVSNQEYATGNFTDIAEVPGLFKLRRTNYAVTGGSLDGNTWYFMEAFGKSGVLRVDSSPSVDHVVVNIEGPNVSFSINGVTKIIEADSDTPIPAANDLIVRPGTGRIWGVVVRPSSVGAEYTSKIHELVRNFPLPEEAESPYSPTTFTFDRDMLNVESVSRLEDVDFTGVPESENLYNGADHPESGTEWRVGYLNIPDTSTMEHVVIDTEGLWAKIGGDMSEDADPSGAYIVGEASFNISFPIFPLDKSVNGGPEELYLVYDTSNDFGNEPISVTAYFLPDIITMSPTSIPDRIATIDSGSVFHGPKDLTLFTGGLRGVAFIEPDAEATDPSEYPSAYGMWAYTEVAGNLATCTSFSVSLTATLALTTTGASDVYVNGEPYVSGDLDKGWNFISFIPDALNNDRIEVGQLDNTNIAYTFSEYYAPTPATYMKDVYDNYVNPPSIRPVNPEIVTITESGGKIYSHDWSISSAD